MTQFDLIAGPLLFVCAAIGFSRGAIREVTSVLAFIASAALALMALRFTAPIGQKLVDPDWGGTALALLIVFGLTYMALRLVGAALSRRIHEGPAAGMLDRSLGAGFGLVRALVILGVFNLLFLAASAERTAPKWVTDATLYPVSAASGKVLTAFAPEGRAAARKVTPVIEKAIGAGSDDPAERERGYDAGEREAMDRLVETTR